MSGVELELRVAWQEHIGDSPEARHWFDTVIGRHRAEGRHYHDARHVAWVVRHVTTIAVTHPPGDLAATVAAAFFHDVVYDPRATDNERQSADLAERALAEIGWAAPRCGHVAELVLATAGHDAEPADPDTRVLIAADLAVLAAEPARYADYAQAVRREYAHLDDTRWREGRGAVLRGLLDRRHLFPPELGLADWERRARANITAELAMLAT